MEQVNYYEVLSLSKDMSISEIQDTLSRSSTIWQQRMMQLPEKAQEMLGYISDAKIIFESESSRANYDQIIAKNNAVTEVSPEEKERDKNFKKWYSDAKKYYDNNQYDLAKIAIEKTIQFLPRDDSNYGDVYYYAAVINHESKDSSTALNYINKAIVLSPDWSGYYRVKCKILDWMSKNTETSQGNDYLEQAFSAINTAISLANQSTDKVVKCYTLQDAAIFYSINSSNFSSKKKAQDDACSYARQAISLGEEFGADVSVARTIIEDIEKENEEIMARMKPFYDSIHYSPDYSPEKLEQENMQWKQESQLLETTVNETSKKYRDLSAEKDAAIKPFDDQLAALETQKNKMESELTSITVLDRQLADKQEEIAKEKNNLSGIIFRDVDIANTQEQLRDAQNQLDSIGKGFFNSGKKLIQKRKIASLTSSYEKLVRENEEARSRKEALEMKIAELISEEHTLQENIDRTFAQREQLTKAIQEIEEQIRTITSKKEEVASEYVTPIKEAEAASQEAESKYQKALQIHQNNVERYSTKFSAVQVGQSIMLGRCIQTRDDENDPIEWIVVDVKDQTILLVSKYILGGNCLHSNDNQFVGWADSTLRKNLNGSFFRQCFTPEEAKFIITRKNNNPGSESGNLKFQDCPPTEDDVFVLSVDEAQKYLTGSLSACKATEWSAKQLISRDNYSGETDMFGLNKSTGYAGYWLRTPSYMSGMMDLGLFYSCVENDGKIHVAGYPSHGTLGVRPSICINLSLLD